MDAATDDGLEARLAALAHDMRTPLNAVMGFAQILRATEADAVRSVQMERILDGAAELEAMIDRLPGLAASDGA